MLPGLQHPPILGDPVLALGRALETFWVDALKPDEDALASGSGSLLDEMRNLVAKRVNLHHKLDANILALAQFYKPVENRFPVAIAREVIVGDEKARYSL